MEPIIQAVGLSKVFGRRASQALQMRRSGKSKAEVESSTGSTIGVFDANFGVYEGEIFVVIGLSGSGKSTLLRLINRLIEPTEGEVYLDGEPISKMPIKQIREIRRKKTGMVFQHFGLFPNRSVLGNVTFGLEVQGVSTEERNRRGEEMLELVGLKGQESKQITELSGGMKQRVGLARALCTGQQLLLMDEPFSALDPLIRRDMQNLFLDIQDEVKRTVVFITHDLDEALRLGHRVAIMKDRDIVQVGDPEDILTNPANEYVERFIEDVDYTKVRLRRLHHRQLRRFFRRSPERVHLSGRYVRGRSHFASRAGYGDRFRRHAWFLANWRVALITVVGFLLIMRVDLWEPSMLTLAQVIASTVVALLLGVPLGILAAQYKTVETIIRPVLDFMQTMPAFVYLVPAIVLLGLCSAPALIAVVVFATPPAVRLTLLGIQQVSQEIVEAAHAFGATPWQTLLKVRLPLALPTIMAGVNQVIMLSLSMVVIAALIGAGGLGEEVYLGLSRLAVDLSFEGGIGIVIIAVIIDRITRHLGSGKGNLVHKRA